MADTTSASQVQRAAQFLRDERLVAFPTETVYGLGADAASARAVLSIYEAKGRPRFNPLIAHVASLELAERLCVFEERARRLARALWPGPLTLVLPCQPGAKVCPLATAGLDTLGVRVPSHPLALALLEAFGGPVVAPSANLSGRVSPTCAEHVLADLGPEVAMVLDGGPSVVGVESTIIGMVPGEPPVLLRAGGLERATVEALLGEDLTLPNPGAPVRSPGALARHYAPSLPLRLEATTLEPGEALLAFGPTSLDAPWLQNLSPNGDLREAARNLFGMLRALDATPARAIAVMPIPAAGLGEAIIDRLHRAAAPRDLTGP